MPGRASEVPSVSLSFANNFWGKDDAGVSPLLERMHNAKVTGEELKSFYTARAAIEDEYARKLLSLARKPLGSSEAGTLRMSLDVVRGETESMGKQHQNIAQQMKTELDEQLTAFAGGMKERRKIVQGGIEKLLKLKTQQTIAVNKARDRYEQDCLKIKGYLAQGHMVMGQEERKNKAKLEKTQIQMSTTSNEYEAAVKILDETTGRWNRDWKVACDKFQDLEEERIDFTKSSLWSFANIASTVCVSDDASCEKVRLSLEDCDVEKDISAFIRECGTGQEIPDAPKFINFCRGDLNDAASEMSDDGSYAVAQFQRTVNPAFRSSSPQPSSFEARPESRGDRSNDVATGQNDFRPISASTTPRKPVPMAMQPPELRSSRSQTMHQQVHRQDFAEVPHNEYPMEGMTQFCRLGPPSERSSVASPIRPASRDSQSEYSNPTSFTSAEPSLGSISPTKQMSDLSTNSGPADELNKKRSGFFQNRSPFRRKSKTEKETPPKFLVNPSTGQRNTWTSASASGSVNRNASPVRQHLNQTQNNHCAVQRGDRLSASPEPADPRAQFQLNVGNNVFDVASPDAHNGSPQKASHGQEELDPIAQALAELKGVTKQASIRVSADRYHGLASPGPGATSSVNQMYRASPLADMSITAANRGTPPPSYEQPSVSRLGAPQPAFTSRQMQQTTQKYLSQKQSMYNSPHRSDSYNQQQQQTPTRTTPQGRLGAQFVNGSQSANRATSPVPIKSASPRPGMYNDPQRPNVPRATSPSPYSAADPRNSRPRAQSVSPAKSQPRNGSYNGQYNDGDGSPAHQQKQHHAPRAVSPQPQFNRSVNSENRSSGSREMALQLAPVQQQGPSGAYSAQGQGQSQQLRGRPSGNMQGGGGRPVSQYGGAGGPVGGDQRTRSRSVVGDGRQLTRDGRPILHFARALYMYQAAIPEELSFGKGDVLAVLRLQDDGWWEAEVVGKRTRPGLVPSNYLQNC